MTVLLLLVALQAGPALTGVAASIAASDLCAAFPSPLAAGTSVTLVRPDPPQSAVAAVVVERVASCEPLERAMITGPFYRLRYGSTADAEENDLAVVFVGVPNPDVRVRSCTSSEGLHLTVWLGEPLVGRRLSRTYFYLAFDVEPSCDVRDYSD